MLNILTEVLQNDVFPALGCTEPIAVAYAAGTAAAQLNGPIERVTIQVDPGVYKNGMAVSIPNTDGARGNLLAGVLGALVRRPELGMQILGAVDATLLEQAQELIRNGSAQLDCDRSKSGLYIEVRVESGLDLARVVIEDSHTHVVVLELNGQALELPNVFPVGPTGALFRQALREASFSDLVDAVEQMSAVEHDYIRQGIVMNVAASQAGRELRRVGHYIAELLGQDGRTGGVDSVCEVMTASATDARMGGLNLPVMSSGGSGNQGIVAILVPYLVGKHDGLDEVVIIKSIALSHLINSYIKCFTGDLSPLCGCAISAGVGAAVAIVYQRAGKDLPKMTLAVNNLISDLGGMLCDGAKEGCALKVASSTSSAIRAAYMALNNHGIKHVEGFVGNSAEETIRNLGRVGVVGMAQADAAMLDIMEQKLRC